MCVQLKLIDHFKLTHHLGLNFACDYSEDHRFFIINDTGLYIFTFTGSVTNEVPKFLCKKYFLRVTDFSPCSHVDLDINSFHCQLPKEDVYEVVMKIEYSANLKHTKPLEPVPLYAQWSPTGLAEHSECFLAVLTNMYSLEVYMTYLDDIERIKYCEISNISEAIIEVEQVNWSDANRFSISMKMEEYRKRIHAVTTTAFTWSHLLETKETKASVIFAGHINGTITAWRISARSFNGGERSSPDFLGRYNTQLKRITNLYWHQSSNNGGGLFFADIEGKMNVVHITNLCASEAIFDKEQLFLDEPDKIKIEKMCVFENDDKTFILVAKQRVLIIYGVNNFGKVFDCTSVYIEDYYITGVRQVDDKILVLSLPGILTELTLKIEDDKITVEKNRISLKYDMERYRTHGCFFSKNMVLFFVVAYPWDLQSFSKTKSYINVFVYQNDLRKPFDLLWHNDSDTIRDHWDCFEILRIICIKEKRFPWLGLDSDLNYDTLSLTKLKTLRWVAKLSEMVMSVIQSVNSYDFKPFILLHYLVEIKLAVNRMTKLLNERRTRQLSDFQMRSLYIQNFFLKEMVAKNILPKANVGKTFIDGIISVMEIANELEYPEPLICVWCGEKILGPLCFPPHVDSRCCISMMPMFVVPDYKCPFCKSIAHKSIEEEYYPIFCPYCDVPMEKVYVSEETLREKCKSFEMQMSVEKKTDCRQDCLQEDIEFDDIEDNTVEYVIFSDSDDETANGLSQLDEDFSKTQISDDTAVFGKEEL